MKKYQAKNDAISVQIPGIGRLYAYRSGQSYYFAKNGYDAPRSISEEKATELLKVDVRTIRRWFNKKYTPPRGPLILLCYVAMGWTLPDEWVLGGYHFKPNPEYIAKANHRNQAYKCTEALSNHTHRPLDPYLLEDVSHALGNAAFWKREFEKEKAAHETFKDSHDKKVATKLRERIEQLEFLCMAQQKRLEEFEQKEKIELESSERWRGY